MTDQPMDYNTYSVRGKPAILRYGGILVLFASILVPTPATKLALFGAAAALMILGMLWAPVAYTAYRRRWADEHSQPFVPPHPSESVELYRATGWRAFVSAGALIAAFALLAVAPRVVEAQSGGIDVRLALLAATLPFIWIFVSTSLWRREFGTTTTPAGGSRRQPR